MKRGLHLGLALFGIALLSVGQRGRFSPPVQEDDARNLSPPGMLNSISSVLNTLIFRSITAVGAILPAMARVQAGG